MCSDSLLQTSFFPLHTHYSPHQADHRDCSPLLRYQVDEMSVQRSSRTVSGRNGSKAFSTGQASTSGGEERDHIIAIMPSKGGEAQDVLLTSIIADDRQRNASWDRSHQYSHSTSKSSLYSSNQQTVISYVCLLSAHQHVRQFR
jgi:hypothetical protein